MPTSSPASTFTYVALGDSTGVGVGASDGRGYVDHVFARLVRDGGLAPAPRLVNLCTSGATSATVLDRQAPRVAAAGSSLVTLFVGGNDLWRGVAPAELGRNLDGIAARLAAPGAGRSRVAPVIVGTLANMAHAPAASVAERWTGLSPATIAARVVEYNGHVRRVAARHGFAVVDLFGVGLADKAHYFCWDGFHPSSDGYRAWADILWPAMEAAIAYSRREGLCA